MTSYPLMIPSLRFAGLLHHWAAEHGITYEQPAQRRLKKGEKTKAQPVIMLFASTADRSALMQVARDKIAAIRTARCSTRSGAARKHPVALDNIAAQLELEYKAIS